VDLTEGVWAALESISVYTPVTLFAALRDEVVGNMLQSTKVELYTATHQILGISQATHSVRDPASMRAFICQSIMKAVMANQSVFGQAPAPLISVVFKGEEQLDVGWKFNPSDSYSMNQGFADRESSSFSLKAIEKQEEPAVQQVQLV